MLCAFAAYRLGLAELAVVTCLEFTLSLICHPGGGCEYHVGPVEEILPAEAPCADVVPAWLEDCHLDSLYVVDVVEGIKGTQRIAHHLRISFASDKDAQAMLVVDDVEDLVGDDDAVSGAETFLDPAGEVQPLFYEHHWILAVSSGFPILFHDIAAVLLSA